MSGWRRRLGDGAAGARQWLSGHASGAGERLPGDGEERRRYARLALVALVVTGFAWGGVRVADPLPAAPEHRPIDTDAPPAAVAHDAMVQTERGSYVVEQYDGNETERRRFFRLRVDNREHRARGTLWLAWADARMAVYASDAGTWRRGGGDDRTGWTIGAPSNPLLDLFEAPSAVTAPGADVAVVSRNASTLLVRVNDTDTALLVGMGWENATGDEPSMRATLTLALDREAGVLRWSRLRWSRLEGSEDDRTRETRVRVRRYRDWGDVEVRRPAGLPATFDTVLFDLANGPPGEDDG